MPGNGPLHKAILMIIGAWLITSPPEALAQGQNPPGRVLTTPGNNNVVECNLDASNCFYVVGNQEGNQGFPSPQSPSVASNGTIAFTASTSPDGTCGGPCNPHVFINNADGTNVRQLTFNANTAGYNGEHDATISPDASIVAFLTNLNAAPGGSQPQQLYLVNADGSNLRQLTPFSGGPDPSQGFVDGLAWSPDSRSMAFRAVVYTSVCGTYGGSPIYVRVIGRIGADGSNPQVIACDNNDGYVNAVDWSPDGTLLAYTRNVQHGAQGCSGCVGEPAVAFIDLSGQNRYAAGITSTQLSGGVGGDSCQSGPHCIHFSPDSTKLAYNNQFTMDGNPCPSQAFCFISTIDLDGTNQTDTPLTVGSGGFWWMAGPAVPAPAQVTLAPATLEYWPGFSQQLFPSLLDGGGNLIMHSAQSFNLPSVYAPLCYMQIGPYGLTTATVAAGNLNTPTVNASNAGLTSDSIPFKCWSSQPCSYSLSSSSENFGNGGGNGQVSVLADPGQNQSACPWNANSSAPWILVTSPLFGAGNGSNTIGFTVAANPGGPRQGSISVAPGMTLTITQDAFNNVTLQSILVSPGSASVGAGLTQQFIATGHYSDSSTQDLTGQATWSSSNPAIASISNAAGSNGLATGVAQGGPVTIQATLNSVNGAAQLTVTAPVLTSIAVTPANPSVPAGSMQPFTATGTYSDESQQNLTNSVSWTSSNTGVATIGASGVATAVAAGSTTISAKQGGISGSTMLVVTTLQSITIAPLGVSTVVGSTVQYSAAGHYSDGSTQDVTATASWTSTKTSVASITSPGGLATAVGKGTTKITAKVGAFSASTSLVVGAATVQSIAVTPVNATIAVGGTQQFTATATYNGGNVVDVTTLASWSTSPKSLASITGPGLVTGRKAGTDIVTARFGGVSGTATLIIH